MKKNSSVCIIGLGFVGLTLAAIMAKRGFKIYGVEKKKDLVSQYLKDGKTFYDIPYDIIEEYGRVDVEATEHVALEQLKIFNTTFEELFGDETSIADFASVA